MAKKTGILRCLKRKWKTTRSLNNHKRDLLGSGTLQQMANVKLYHVTNPLLNVNFSLHLPRNRNLSVVTAAALRAGVSFFREWQRIEQLRTCAESYADSKLLLATYLIDVSQTIKKKKIKKIYKNYNYNLQESSARNIPDRCIVDCEQSLYFLCKVTARETQALAEITDCL